ncbi:hypothetical protein AT2G13105 [Arabidopsis thaliana]|uniref:Uncharacterized protein n=1 Tax=Arabidopsis thaliana TaxID=3702 RepID=A0A1P8AXI7_ARATH|nr:uncharacterized protein AT2G13105 [Arabidopsis thaliana]ANM61353.1 hypothetical protein AT2G13105 [Arabidopsis thaliana]|eukprot:NP_001323576.1 hypothetical protein AT2G13105 [Arabidopsis thaliana]
MSQNLDNELRIYSLEKTNEALKENNEALKEDMLVLKSGVGKVMDELATTRLAMNAIMKSLGVTIIPPELVALARDAGLGVHGSAGGRDSSPAPIVSPAPTTSPAVSLAVSRAASPTVPSTRTQQSPLDAWCASLGI